MPLTAVDLRRLVRGSGLAPEALVDWIAPEDIDMTGEPETFVRLRAGRRLMVLRHEGGGCRFLDGDSCSAYEYRPTACAAYPYDIEPTTGRSELLPRVPCEPGPTPALDQRQAGLRLAAELRAYAELVSEWNRRQGWRVRLLRPPRTAERFLALVLANEAPPDRA